MNETAPPQDLAAERAVLGCLVNHDRHTFPDVMEALDALRAGHFHGPAHSRVWLAIRRLIADGAPINEKTLPAELLADVAPLASRAAVPAELPYYMAKLDDAARRRDMWRVCGSVLEDLNDAPVDALAERLRFAAESPAGTVALPTLAEAVGEFLDRQGDDDDERTYFPWPGGHDGVPEKQSTIAPEALLPRQGGEPSWGELWKRVGPLWPDRLAVLVGATGRGKSGFALCVAEAVARAGHPVLFLSAEMGRDELVARLLVLRARGDDAQNRNGVPYFGVLAGKAPAEDVGEAAVALVNDCPHLYLWAPTAEQRTPEALETMTRAVVKDCDGQPPLVVVDYLQRMADGADLRQAVRAVSGKLRDLSRPGGLGRDWPGAAVLALSSTARSNYEHFADVDALKTATVGGHIHRTVDGKKSRIEIAPIPLEGMGKESGELETDAALLLCMTTNRGEDDSPRDALVAIGKNRHGGGGVVEMTFMPASGVFTERPEPPKRNSVPRRGKK